MAAEKTQDAKAIWKISGVIGELEVEDRRAIITFLEAEAMRMDRAKAATMVAKILAGLDQASRDRVLAFFRSQLDGSSAAA